MSVENRVLSLAISSWVDVSIQFDLSHLFNKIPQGSLGYFRRQDTSQDDPFTFSLSTLMLSLGEDLSAYAGDGNDRIEGGNGDNSLYGGAGSDALNGGVDDDVITGDIHDQVNGGSGKNTFILAHGETDETVHIFIKSKSNDFSSGPHIILNNFASVVGHEGNNVIKSGHVLRHDISVRSWR